MGYLKLKVNSVLSTRDDYKQADFNIDFLDDTTEITAYLKFDFEVDAVVPPATYTRILTLSNTTIFPNEIKYIILENLDDTNKVYVLYDSNAGSSITMDIGAGKIGILTDIDRTVDVFLGALGGAVRTRGYVLGT